MGKNILKTKQQSAQPSVSKTYHKLNSILMSATTSNFMPAIGMVLHDLRIKKGIPKEVIMEAIEKFLDVRV